MWIPIFSWWYVVAYVVVGLIVMFGFFHKGIKHAFRESSKKLGQPHPLVVVLVVFLAVISWPYWVWYTWRSHRRAMRKLAVQMEATRAKVKAACEATRKVLDKSRKI